MFTAIVYVLASGCAWRDLPPSFGMPFQTAQRRFNQRVGERRALANPGLGGRPYATPTLWAAIQYLMPGEDAPSTGTRGMPSGSGNCRGGRAG